MQSHVRRRPDTRDLTRAYKARFGDADVPASDDELREALSWDAMMERFSRDERLSSMPDYFDLYETAEARDDRIRRTRAGLAALLQGDPEEQRETWDLIRDALDGEGTCSAVESTSNS